MSPAVHGDVHGPATVRVVNPATEEVIAEVPAHGAADVDVMVRRAHEALGPWRALAPADRARLLRRFAEVVDAHRDELALLETRNVGKPLADSVGEVAMVADVLHFYAGAVDKHTGSTIPVSGGVDLTWHEPLGVVAAIVPWNFPIAITSWKVGPALACGNTVIVKPSQLTPLTRAAPGRARPRRRACPTVCSRSWWGRVPASDRHSSSTPASPRCRSRDRPKRDAT